MRTIRSAPPPVRVIPFFSCGAKLPILTAVAGAIVASAGVGNADVITMCMYLLGICTAIVTVILMRSTTMRGEVPPFIMELPAYHAPRFSSLMIHLWDKTKHYVKKAFTIILASTIVIWFFSSFNWSWEFLINEDGDNLRMSESILGSLGMLIQPLFTPLGFGSQLGEFGWVFAVAAITGLVAKENVIATFGTLAAAIVGSVISTEDGVEEVVAMIEGTGIGVPALIAFIAFNMLTIPCFAACATARAELPKGKFRVDASVLARNVIYCFHDDLSHRFVVVDGIHLRSAHRRGDRGDRTLEQKTPDRKSGCRFCRAGRECASRGGGCRKRGQKMTWYEILIIVAACLIVVGVIVSGIVRKKQGKSGCDCGCSSCSGCAGCSSRKPAAKKGEQTTQHTQQSP